MHASPVFTELPLSDNLAKLLFHSCLAKSHSIKSTENCLQLEMSLKGSIKYDDFKGKIIYKDQSKYFGLLHFIIVINNILGNYQIESIKLMDDWNNSKLRNLGYYRNNPSTRNAMYAYIERLESTELEKTAKLTNLPSILNHPPIELYQLIRLNRFIERILSSTTFSVMNHLTYPTPHYQGYTIEKSSDGKNHDA